ncbi:glycosyltransferase [Neorhizobium sp. NPDC001467]|uniref:glycosyltransferase n=1 Tax=Neorhizobium sp. NPDC001467 TaxID=3390595 RepID=UPI003D073087
MLDKNKIVVLLKGYPRLSETFIAQELLGLERAGLSLELFSMRRPTDTKRHPIHAEIRAPVRYLPEYLHEEPVRVLRSLVTAVRRPGFGRALRQFLSDLRRDFSRNRFRRFGQAAVLVAEWPQDADWLYVHFIHTPASVGAYAGLIAGIPWSVSAHAKDIWTSPGWDLEAKLGQARWAVTCTRAGYDHLTALAARPGVVNLSYHGLDLDRFPVFAGRENRRDGSCAEDPAIILSVGRAVKKKGYDTLLRALALLPKTLHWRFRHIGGGEQLPALKVLAQNLGLTDRIEWLGALAQVEVLDHDRNSDVFALASRITDDGDRDGLPNVLVEAASQRMACVATDQAGISELFVDGENGLLVPPEDPAALAVALERMIREPALRQRLGEAAEERVRREFDHRASISQLETLFATHRRRADG